MPCLTEFGLAHAQVAPTFYPHMLIGKLWIYHLLFCVFVCLVTDFSAEINDSGVKFCTAVHRRPSQGISHSCERRSPTHAAAAASLPPTATIHATLRLTGEAVPLS